MPEGFVFSPDGRYLFGSSYYTGVSNLFRFEIASGEIKALTNAETGFFRPIPRPTARLLALEYSGTGFVPTVLAAEADRRPRRDHLPGHEIAEQAPDRETWNAGSPGRVPLDSLVTRRENTCR